MGGPIAKIEWMDKVIPSLGGGINLDERPELLADGELVNAEGIIYDANTIRLDKGYVGFAEAVIGTPRAAFQFFQTTGTEELVLVTNSTFYTYATAQDAWELVSNGTSTTLSGNEASGQTVLSVTDETGFTTNELIGIRLNDGSQHISTIASTAAGTITIDDALPSAADSGNVVLEGVSLAGDDDDVVSFVVLPSDNWLVFTNGTDNVKKYDGSTCEDLGGLTNTSCKFLGLLKDHLILFHTIEGGTAYPQRVKNSDTADFDEFTSGNAGSTDLYDSEDFILSSVPLGPYQIIYRDRSIVRMEYVGSSTKLFNFEYVVYGEGPVSSDGVIDMVDYHIFSGNANVYEYRGGLSIEPIGDKIYNLVFSKDGYLSPDYRNRMFSLYVEELDECWFFYPSSDAQYPDKLLRYKPSQEAWYQRTFNHNFVGFGFYRTSTTKRWLDLVGSWLDQTFRWNSVRFLANAPTTLLCAQSPNQVYSYDYIAGDDAGTAIQYTIETKDFSEPGYFLRIDHLALRARGSGITISYSEDRGSNWTVLGTYNPGPVYTTQVISMNKVLDQVRWRIEGSGGGLALSWARFRYALESPEM